MLHPAINTTKDYGSPDRCVRCGEERGDAAGNPKMGLIDHFLGSWHTTLRAVLLLVIAIAGGVAVIATTGIVGLPAMAIVTYHLAPRKDT